MGSVCPQRSAVLQDMWEYRRPAFYCRSAEMHWLTHFYLSFFFITTSLCLDYWHWQIEKNKTIIDTFKHHKHTVNVATVFQKFGLQMQRREKKNSKKGHTSFPGFYETNVQSWHDWFCLKSGEKMDWASDLPHHKILYVLPKETLTLQTHTHSQTVTDLPTDIQLPILVTVHLFEEQTGKAITKSSKVTYLDTWLDQKNGDGTPQTLFTWALLLWLISFFQIPGNDGSVPNAKNDRVCKILLN